MTLLVASARADVANYLSTLIYVYELLIFAYIIIQLLFGLGIRPPYARWSDAVLTFLRDVVDPYLRIFRRFIPLVGPFDLSPIVAIIALQIFNSLIVQNLIHG